MKKTALLAALFLASLSSVPAQAAPWKNASIGVRINLPGQWKPITAKMAAERAKAAKDPADAEFYGKVKARLGAGDFFLFEEKPRGKVRADLQVMRMGKPLRALTEQDILNLCPLWAERHGENERPFSDCRPRKLGNAWTAYLEYEADEAGYPAEYTIRHFKAQGDLVLLTVTGTREEAEAIFRNTKFF